VLRRAEEVEVRRIITIGHQSRAAGVRSSSRKIIPLFTAAIGVHPSHAEEAEDDVITPLRELAKNPRVVAIGETGLDLSPLGECERVAKEEQVQVMTALRSETDEEIEAQIRDGACKSKRRVCSSQQLDFSSRAWAQRRDSSTRTRGRTRWRYCALMRGKVRGVFHCFGGSLDQANEVLNLDHLVSFTGLLLFKTA